MRTVMMQLGPGMYT
jgi:DnaJ homolog subfamily A member 2